MNAVREGRMRVAGAIERSQTVKEQLNVRIIGLDHQIEEIKRQINDQEKKKKIFLVRRSKRSMRRKNDLRSNVIMPRESKKH
ncbi:MAG: hypothetical protein ACLVFD_11955 [Anaerostipes hadrus]